MNEPIDVTTDSVVDGAQPGNDEPNRDELEDLVRTAAAPKHVIREDAPTIDEDDPAPPRESEAVLPPTDAKMPDAAKAQEKWEGELRDAASRWERLTEEDLLDLGGHFASLSDLVRKRYALSLEETERQVTAFIKDHQSSAL
jgi:hypothetical protein